MGANPAAVFLWIAFPWLFGGGLIWGVRAGLRHIREQREEVERERFINEWSKRLDAS